ncbi:Clavata3/ESR (CLE) protein [Quillaja saponaria]|uniref:Clavata3/ESR (CLE) protein n=1 Tax=Quillaja saponaria TaxID=32244 RepID=A0AAD7LAS1_QUISA|nr:Clavata3/ESR (CLE) protein [Quillaja saponaria]
MKSSLSSNGGWLLIVMVLLCFSVSSANRVLSSSPTIPTISSRKAQNPHKSYCDSFPHASSRSLCIHLQRIHGFRPIQQPPLRPQLHEIDPRYGVEKRLVPSGPNPLHN